MTIGNSFLEYCFILTSIALLRAIAPASAAYLILCAWQRKHALFNSAWVTACACIELAFFLFVYLPRRRRLQHHIADQPPQLTRKQREALFWKCASEIGKANVFMSWFLPQGADAAHLKRSDVVEWLLWAFFRADRVQVEWVQEIEEYVASFEAIIGKKFDLGKSGKLKSIRTTLDPVLVLHRPLLWYIIVAVVDTITCLRLLALGFDHYAPTSWFNTFPPRPLLAFVSRPAVISASTQLSYWYRPHRSHTKSPLLFLHGIGIGLHPYLALVQDIIANDPDVGIILVEILPMSMHMTRGPVPGRTAVLDALEHILASLHVERTVLMSHSYGTYLSALAIHSACPQSPIAIATNTNTTNETHDDDDDDDDHHHHHHGRHPHPIVHRIAHTVLIDPIPILLHLPAVAYNFLHRPPARAAEWQVWYLVSRDPDVARTLGRAFPWEQGALWGDDLAHFMEARGVDQERLACGAGAGAAWEVVGGGKHPPFAPVCASVDGVDGFYSSKGSDGTYLDGLNGRLGGNSDRNNNRGGGAVGQQAPCCCCCRGKGRNLTVVLCGEDQIVPAETIRRYLTGEENASARWVGTGPNWPWRESHGAQGLRTRFDESGRSGRFKQHQQHQKQLDEGVVVTEGPGPRKWGGGGGGGEKSGGSERMGGGGGLERSKAGEPQLEVFFYPGLDHAMIFDTKERRRDIVDAVHRYVNSNN